jgi:hypothetical protein
MTFLASYFSLISQIFEEGIAHTPSINARFGASLGFFDTLMRLLTSPRLVDIFKLKVTVSIVGVRRTLNEAKLA